MSLILSLLLRASSVVIGFQTVLGWENRIFYIFVKVCGFVGGFFVVNCRSLGYDIVDAWM